MTTYDKIRERRRELNMSQADFAKKLGYSDRSTISRIEAGKVDISLPTLYKMADVLDTTAAELFGLDEMFAEPKKPETIKDKLLNAIGLAIDEYVSEPSDKEKKLLELFNGMSSTKQNELLRYAEFISKS